MARQPGQRGRELAGRPGARGLPVAPHEVRSRVAEEEAGEHVVDFVASYANYYVCNGGVVAAQFGDRDTDAAAVDALGRHYPGREIVTLNTDPLGEIGGGIHCATQQMPT